MFMRMKKITIALAAALAVLSACEKTPALPVVQFDQEKYIMDSDKALTVKVVSDKALTADVDFTIGGDAVKGEDYTISVEKTVSFAEAYTAEIVITPLNNLEEKSIILELSGKAGEFTLGTNAKTTVGVTPKEKVYCSFVQSATLLPGTFERTVSLKLIGADTGEKFKASGELKVPFTVSGTAVEGTDYEIVGGEKFFVAGNGENVATVKVRSKYETLPETLPTLTFNVVSGERFLAGVKSSTELVFGNVLQFTEFVGKWAYSSYPLLDDSEASKAKAAFDAILKDAGDTWEKNIPCHNTKTDVIEFKEVDGGIRLITSGDGDIFDYLVDADVIDMKPEVYEFYHYREYGVQKPFNDAVTLTLSDVNYDFAKGEDNKNLKKGDITVNLSDEGQTLDLFIKETSFDPVNGVYFYNIRHAYEGAVWFSFMGLGTYDQYYVFKKVAE